MAEVEVAEWTFFKKLQEEEKVKVLLLFLFPEGQGRVLLGGRQRVSGTGRMRTWERAVAASSLGLAGPGDAAGSRLLQQAAEGLMSGWPGQVQTRTREAQTQQDRESRRGGHQGCGRSQPRLSRAQRPRFRLHRERHSNSVENNGNSLKKNTVDLSKCVFLLIYFIASMASVGQEPQTRPCLQKTRQGTQGDGRGFVTYTMGKTGW